jgi:hypothetical protein
MVIGLPSQVELMKIAVARGPQGKGLASDAITNSNALVAMTVVA